MTCHVPWKDHFVRVLTFGPSERLAVSSDHLIWLDFIWLDCIIAANDCYERTIAVETNQEDLLMIYSTCYISVSLSYGKKNLLLRIDYIYVYISGRLLNVTYLYRAYHLVSSWRCIDIQIKGQGVRYFRPLVSCPNRWLEVIDWNVISISCDWVMSHVKVIVVIVVIVSEWVRGNDQI